MQFILKPGYRLLLVGECGNPGMPAKPGLYANGRGTIAWLAGQGYRRAMRPVGGQRAGGADGDRTPGIRADPGGAVHLGG